MGLRLKFNLVLLAVFGLGLLASGYLSYTLLERNARDEVSRNAGLMMETALAIRGYTIEQVRPHLELQLMRVFLPQSVPAYAATEMFNALRKKYPDYTYKEATINPTNPRNRAGDWENDVVRIFRDKPDTPSRSRIRPASPATPPRRWHRQRWSSSTVAPTDTDGS
jgi:protein-histidine pros-kinase